MKIVKKGWIGNSESARDILKWEKGYDISGMYLAIEKEFVWDTKGKSGLWSICDWPPRHVTITIEVED